MRQVLTLLLVPGHACAGAARPIVANDAGVKPFPAPRLVAVGLHLLF